MVDYHDYYIMTQIAYASKNVLQICMYIQVFPKMCLEIHESFKLRSKTVNTRDRVL